MNKLILAAALAATFTTAPAFAASLNASEVQAKLSAAGYTQVFELERDDGIWEADVIRADGRMSEVIIDASNGEIFDPHSDRPMLDAAQILTLARKAGLTHIESVERDGATWTLEARNARNQRVDVRMSGHDGRIISTQRDNWWD
jgi:uncharacterized membrane protein YkoI